MNNSSAFTVCPTKKDITSPTLDPEPSQPPPTPCTDPMSEVIADGEPTMIPEAAPELEAEPNGHSNQVHEPATSSVPVGVLVEYEGMEWSPTTSEGELHLASGKYYEDLEEDIPRNVPFPLVPPSSKFPASLLVLPRSESPLSPLVLPSSKSLTSYPASLTHLLYQRRPLL